MTDGIPADETTDGASSCPAGGADDAELLARMARADADELRARRAWGEFYARHADYLRAVCLRAYAQMLGGPDGVGDLVSETFALAYRRAGTFRTEGITDPHRLGRRVRAWLGWIARRLVQDALRGRRRVRETHLHADHWQQIARDESGSRPDSPDVQRLREALLHLTTREQWVLRVTFQYYQPDKDHQRLPNAVCAELAQTLRTTPQNLRQIRRRALAKLARRLRPANEPAD
jgi:RNA polymerase sigma factor (sigma-70 family)